MKFASSKFWKTFMARLYGWGASVVILGALFKIMHWQYADEMLILGMGTEVLVFFLSGFEKPAEEPDWSLVYPELEGIEVEGGTRREARGMAGGTANITLSQNLDKLLEEANIGPELINTLGRGLRNLSDNAGRLADMSNAAVATNQYIQNIESASKSVIELNQAYKNTAEYMKHGISLSQEYSDSLKHAAGSMSELSESYKQTAMTAKENLYVSEEFSKSIKNATGLSNQMGEAYSKQAAILTNTVEAFETSAAKGKALNDQLHKTSQNLSALNAAYELQLQAAGLQTDSTEKLNKSIGSLAENIQDSASNVKQYQVEMEQLNNNIRALNNVYGNMLSAMNFNANR
jgi:gliding motility-associated protein GldL